MNAEKKLTIGCGMLKKLYFSMMKKVGRWIKKHFKVELVIQTSWHALGVGAAWTWNSDDYYFTTGPMIHILFWAIALELVYKKNKAL